MSRTRQSSFSTIRTEGALLPSDFLQRIADLDRIGHVVVVSAVLSHYFFLIISRG